jgi:hypothetical protein
MARFSLLRLFEFVGFVAVGCAALTTPTRVWSAAISVIAYLLLPYSVFSAVYGRSAGRPFWLGFTVLAWGYLALDHVGKAERPPNLLTTQHLQNLILGPPPPLPANAEMVDVLSSPAYQEYASAEKHFGIIAHWLWTLLLGFIGGLLARQLYLWRGRAAQETGTPHQQL